MKRIPHNQSDQIVEPKEKKQKVGTKKKTDRGGQRWTRLHKKKRKWLTVTKSMTWKIINTVRSAREDIDPAAGANHKMRAFYSVLCEPCELWYILFSLHTLSSACSDRQGKRLLKNLVGSGKTEVENFQQSLRPPRDEFVSEVIVNVENSNNRECCSSLGSWRPVPVWVFCDRRELSKIQ